MANAPNLSELRTDSLVSVSIQNVTPAFDTLMSHHVTNLQHEDKCGMTPHLRISIMNWQFTAKVCCALFAPRLVHHRGAQTRSVAMWRSEP